MKKTEYTHIIWDFNGTIYDDVDACIKSANRLLGAYGLPLVTSVESYRAKVAPYAMQEEDLLSLAMLDEIAVKYFEWRKNRHGKLDSRATGNSSTHPV